MVSEPDGFEQFARIVEAHEAGQPDEVIELLREIGQAIRDKAIDD